MRKPPRQTLFFGAVVVGIALVAGFLFVTRQRDEGPEGPPLPDSTASSPDETSVQTVSAPRSSLSLADIPIDGRRAYGYLKQVCELGPRPSGSAAMRKQQDLLTDYFRKLGGRVRLQKFEGRHPTTGAAVSMANLIVQWHPERKTRVLLCAHYDTRPFPDRDRRHPRGTFIGANDGGSGVAVLMELGHWMPKLEGTYGVDFVLLDAEEFVFPGFPRDRGEYFLGSTHFASDYRQRPPAHQYAAGILLDMVGDADLQILYEKNGMRYENTRKLIIDIWNVARRLGVREFVQRAGYTINDDHIPLNKIARIPTCDIIDFDYPHWHTEQDTVKQCSPLSLAKVGWVVHEWLVAINR